MSTFKLGVEKDGGKKDTGVFSPTTVPVIRLNRNLRIFCFTTGMFFLTGHVP